VPCINVILQLHAARTVQLDFLERLTHNIVGLMLGCLGLFDGSTLVNVALVVYIEFTKGILQVEDLALLKLGVLPRRTMSGAAGKGKGWWWGSTYRWSLMIFMAKEELGKRR
jgi:hypothetical protein